MKILQVNKFYYPRGGADKYFLDLTRALKKAGQEVAVFSMDHPKNLPTPWSRYFVSRVSFNEDGLKNKLKIPGRVLYSREAKKKFARLIKDFKPNIIHIHNIYEHISPSILTAVRKYKIPVVMHLHDYKLICPNYTLFTKDTNCERCRPRRYYQCLLNRCIKNSLAGSALAMLEMYLHHSILKIYKKNVSVFIAPSHFMKEVVSRFGWSAKKIKVIYNCYSRELMTGLINEGETNKKFNEDKFGKNANYLLYFGRLSREKGLKTLIQAAALTGQTVKIAGAGPETAALKELTAELKAPVEFLGFKKPTELKPLIINAEAVIIPSIWPENMPLSLLEAMSLGKTVIASHLGGLPEVIAAGQNGLLFEPGDVEDLARQIKKLAVVDKNTLSAAAIRAVSAFSPEKNTAAVIAVYRELLK